MYVWLYVSVCNNKPIVQNIPWLTIAVALSQIRSKIIHVPFIFSLHALLILENHREFTTEHTSLTYYLYIDDGEFQFRRGCRLANVL